MLAELRRVSGNGIALRELGRRIRHDFDERDAGWIQAAVESLRKDGLARVESVPETAGAPVLVAEERAPYGAGPEESQNQSLDRTVNLP